MYLLNLNIIYKKIQNKFVRAYQTLIPFQTLISNLILPTLLTSLMITACGV